MPLRKRQVPKFYKLAASSSPSQIPNITWAEILFPMRHIISEAHANVLMQKYYMMIFVVKTVPVADLVKNLEIGNRISKGNVIRESESNSVQL